MYPEISNFPFEDSENVAALLNDIIQEDGFAEGNLPSNLEDDFLIGEFLPLMKQTEEYIDQFRAEGSTVNIVSPTGDQQQGFPLFPGKKYKPPALNHPSLLSSDENIRLAIISQPSEKHRARYPSEGSRGAIKGREHFEYPEIQLQGYFGSSTVTLQIFLANETGNVKPHGLYQAVIVKGRRRRDCITKVIQDTNVLETKLKSSNNYRAKVDFIGILKIRIRDAISNSRNLTSKKSNKVRLAFRVLINENDPYNGKTLQTVSETIIAVS